MRWSLRLAPLLLAFVAGNGCSNDDSTLYLVGSVERTLIELSAPMSEVILEIPVRRGQHVDAGHVIVQLDTTLAQAEVARAEAGVAGAQARVAVTAHDLERTTDLHRRRIASEDQLEHAQLAADEAAAGLREASALLASAQKRLRDFTIVTLVGGVIDQLPFDLGERVPAGAVVAVLLQDGEPWVRVWIPERAVTQLAPGVPVSVRVDGIDTAMRGRLLDISREPEFTPHYALTERERVHLVYESRVLIEAPPLPLRPGMPATVLISLPASSPERRE